jgi:hypothetical protein
VHFRPLQTQSERPSRTRGLSFRSITPNKNENAVHLSRSARLSPQYPSLLAGRTDDNPALFVGRNKRISHKTIRAMLLQISRDLKPTANAFHPHSFRKYFNQSLKLFLPTEMIEFLQGRLSGVRSHYGDYSPTELISALKPHYSVLQLVNS